MWCKRARTQLSAYADGELGSKDSRLLEEHLTACEACSREHATLRMLARLTTLVPEEELPNGLHARIVTGLAYARTAPAQRARTRSSNPWLLTAFAGAAAALAMGVIAARTDTSPVQQQSGVPHGRQVQTAAERPRTETPDVRVKEAAPPIRRHVISVPRRIVEAEAAPVRDRPQVAEALTGRGALVAEPPASTPVEPTVKKPQPARPGRVVPVLRAARPQPVAEPALPGKPVAEIRTPEPASPSVPVAAAPAGMPGDAVTAVTGNGGPVPTVMAMMTGEGMTHTAGMMADSTTPTEGDDEGLQSLRMFFEERNRSIPQPPPASRERRMRKPL